MEKEFKIGDKVKIIRVSGTSNKIGDIGIITEFTRQGDIARVTVQGRKNEVNWSSIQNLEHYQEDVVLDIVLEEEFVLPEIWYIIVTKENQDVVTKWREVTGDYKLPTGHLTGICVNNNGDLSKGHNPGRSVKSANFGESKNLSGFNFGKEITFEQFKKYVLKEKPIVEPLPFFKVLIGDDAENTIFQVQNNEGNVFQIGDKIKGLGAIASNAGTMIISRFRYTNNRTNICACTKQFHDYGIGIDKIEHVLEFKKDEIVLDIIESKIPENESNLDKAKRLYPVGTIFYAARGNINPRNKYTVKSDSKFRENPDSSICIESAGNGTVHYRGNWAEIISKPEIKESVIITSSLKDMLDLQNQGVKKVITIQSKKEETLLEKAKRLFSIGTHFEGLGLYYSKGQHFIVKTPLHISTFGNIITTSGTGQQAVISADGSKVAKILYNGYKVGDTINNVYVYTKNTYNNSFSKADIGSSTIIKLETIDGQEVAFFGEDNKHNRILIKNIKK